MAPNKTQGNVWGPAAVGSFAPLKRDSKADVVVVGAGFIGLAAALELAENGRKVVLLDAGPIGASASAISAGHVGPMLYGARKGPDDIIKLLGSQMGERLNAKVARSGAALFEIIAREKIECGHRRGYVGVYRSDRSLDRAANRFGLWARLGGKARRLSKAEVRDHIASDRYAGGFLIEDGGWVDPLRLLEGLASAASGAGVNVHSGSPVASAVREGQHWTVRTARGSAVTATDIILATGVATPKFAGPEIAGSTIKLACGVAASSPDAARFERLLPGGGPVADFDDPAVFAPVVDEHGRLVVSMLMRASGGVASQALRPAQSRLTAVFGQQVEFPGFASGLIPVTLDGLPNLIRRDDGLIAVTGCNGFGLTLGMVAAREAARLVLGRPTGELALPVKAPSAIRGGAFIAGIMRNVVIPLANRLGK